MNFFYSKDNLVALHFKYDQARRRFVEWARNEIAVVPDFHKRILFSDEAHFWLNGYVNKQNCRIWSEANPQELWFQQDGATCHTARATINLLKDTFGDRLISRFGPVNWSPRSCDLTALDYFLWDYVKSLVYADKPQTLDHLEDNIRRVIADILPKMLEKVIENWTSRLDYIRASRGSHMPEFIFKMLFKKGKSYRELAKIVSRSHSCVQKIIGRFNSDGLIENKSGRGRKSILSDVAKRKVLKDIKIDPKLSAVKLAAETSRIMGRSSPDINVIEHLWATFETAVQKHQIRNKAHLKQVLQEEWDKISPGTTKKLVESVPRRLKDIIKAKGLATKY
ncbi:DUF4817 domain-containing protein [Trichonephila clavipes]|nr:DUF4817 domain-containing protein [Trichonephila clavipes]